MMDYWTAVTEVEYRRSQYLGEAKRDEILALMAASADGSMRASSSVLGILIAALLTLVMAGALAPR